MHKPTAVETENALWGFMFIHPNTVCLELLEPPSETCSINPSWKLDHQKP